MGEAPSKSPVSAASSQLFEGALVGARIPVEVALAEFGNLGMHGAEHVSVKIPFAG